MSSKVIAAFIVLAILAVALLAESVLLGGGKGAIPEQPGTRCPAAQIKACPLGSASPCCAAAEPAQGPPIGCVKACCEAKKEAGTCSAAEDPEACPEICPKCCCPPCPGPDCCPQPCCSKTEDTAASAGKPQRSCCAAR